MPMLYIVGTPIGNLEDLSIRQAKIISSADILVTEDTRSTGILLEAIERLFGFKRNPDQYMISYYREKEFEQLPKIMKLLDEEKNIALISQAGMPLISDPGYLLVKTVIAHKIQYSVIPGPSAVTTALVASGFDPSNFMFIGFLPKKQSDLYRSIDRSIQIGLIQKDLVFVFYESPQRISQTLQILYDKCPEANVVICRELTKKFEEIVRGKPKDLAHGTYKGEIALLIKFN